MMEKKKKSFDAVEESRKWRRETSALLATMTPQEQMDFLNRRLTRVGRVHRKKDVMAIHS